MQHTILAPCVSALSRERLSGYGLPSTSEADALARYLWNAALSEALYPVLQTLEIALRNSLSNAAAAQFGAVDWLQTRGYVSLRHSEQAKIDEAIQRMNRALAEG